MKIWGYMVIMLLLLISNIAKPQNKNNDVEILWIIGYSCNATYGEYVNLRYGSIVITSDTISIYLSSDNFFKLKITEKYTFKGELCYFLEHKNHKKRINVVAILKIERNGVPSAIFNINDGHTYETYEFKIYDPTYYKLKKLNKL